MAPSSSDLEALLASPSASSWDAIVSLLEAPEQPAGTLERVAIALESSWPRTLQRTPPLAWVLEGDAAKLELCHAPAGIWVWMAAGGGGLPSYSRSVMAAPETLGDALLIGLSDLIERTGDPQPVVEATWICWGHAIATRDLLPCVGSRTHQVALSSLDEEALAKLRAHVQKTRANPNHNPHTDGPLVPLKLEWTPHGLPELALEGSAGWLDIEELRLYRDDKLYDESILEARALHEDFAFASDIPEDPLGLVLVVPSIPEHAMLEEEGSGLFGALRTAATPEMAVFELIRWLNESGLWRASTSLDDAHDHALHALETSRRSPPEAIVGSLREDGEARGPLLETTDGLMRIAAGRIEPALLGTLHSELDALAAAEKLLLTPGWSTESMIPLAVWALEQYPRRAAAARAALAERLLDHPGVDDLMCGDEELLAHAGAPRSLS